MKGYYYYQFIVSLLLIVLCIAAPLKMADFSNSCIGFLGCGKISSAVCRGYASAAAPNRPQKIIVSTRSESKSQALKDAYPDLIEVSDSNEYIVNQSNIVLIGLLPNVAREVLPVMPFTDDKMVISMMAAIDFDELLSLVKLPASRVVRTVPLPSAARRSGPILSFPTNALIESVLSVVGTPIVCANELEMKPMVSVTGHISSFFELMRVTQDWCVDKG